MIAQSLWVADQRLRASGRQNYRFTDPSTVLEAVSSEPTSPVKPVAAGRDGAQRSTARRPIPEPT